ncbi:uncharacterized protein FOMMEDRAFT_27258 [Fomitiporia mediterranea MF3/22]|uniref:uncharacterized protein n=1 Tax=Fomitiporia mediterranea (strain MF3/22) TaxID=694068 RepID=UPI0004409AEA|nr:uncharacterized protein FOMMEDRAFT_27258 [Fomitiporia mediterranea MF3/22]EJD04991.1 hypothetical protein FOMMEDRAFT_27258 [Fomitiporia mediterranea MF3/22]
MDNEIYFFWDNTFSVTNLVFVLSLHFMSIHSCIFSQWGINLLDWIILICMDYRKSRTTTRLLFAMLVIDGTVTLGVVIDGLIVEKVSAFALPGNISQCGIQATAPVVQKYLYWGIVLIYQTIAVGLASYKAMYLRKTLGFRGIQLVNTIITDQNIYITFVLACSITNIFATLTEHKGIVRERSTYICDFWTPDARTFEANC